MQAGRFSFSPTGIEALPDDVLKLVLQTASDGANLLGEFPLTRLGIAVAISHVSRRCRALALDSPRLWATITHEQWLWVAFQLKQSRTAPLTVVWRHISGGGDAEPPTDILGSVLAQAAARLRTLDLFLTSTDFDDMLSHLHGHMPLLQSLAFEVLEIPDWDSDVSEFTSVTEPLRLDAAFSTCTPSLRSLSLNEAVFPWSEATSLWPALTHLKLSTWDHEELTVEIFSRALQKLPHLQFLRTSLGTIDETELPLTQDVSTIPLLALRTLDMGLDFKSAVEFLGRLIVTERCSISLTLIYPAKITDIEPHLRIAEILPRSLGRSVQTLQLKLKESEEVDRRTRPPHANVQLKGELYSFKPESDEHEDAGPRPKFDLDIHFVPCDKTDKMFFALCGLYDLVRIHTIEILELSKSVTQGAAFWDYLSKTCASAETVKLNQEAMDVFVDALLRKIEQDVPTMLFPNVRHLELPQMNQIETKTKIGLQNILRVRQEHGIRMQTLKVRAEDTRDRDEWTEYAEEIILEQITLDLLLR